MTTTEPQDRPQPPEPGAFATTSLDKLLRSWHMDPVAPATETPESYFSRRLMARAIDAARVEGLNVRDVITSMGRCLTSLAGEAGAATIDPDAFALGLAAIPEAKEPMR